MSHQSKSLAWCAVNIFGAMQKERELEAFIRYIEPFPIRNVLEIGSMHGGTLVVWDHLKEDEGKLICIDKFVLEGRLERLPSFVELIFLNRDSHDPSTVKQIEQVLQGEKLDLLFIDGDHSYEGVKADFNMYKHLVAEDGVIALHDVSVPHINVGEHNIIPFWNELKTQYDHFEIFDSEYTEKPNWGGIGVVQI